MPTPRPKPEEATEPNGQRSGVPTPLAGEQGLHAVVGEARKVRMTLLLEREPPAFRLPFSFAAPPTIHALSPPPDNNLPKSPGP
jgi:hypothetical protein